MSNGSEGDALIHLRVPAALKGRWVRESRAAGMRLTDWIIERLERKQEPTVQSFKIPDALADAYRGAGWALAALAGGQPVALRYVADVAPDLDEALAAGGETARHAVQRWMLSPAAGPVVRELQALGEISVGMCSAWEFVEQ